MLAVVNTFISVSEILTSTTLLRVMKRSSKSVWNDILKPDIGIDGRVAVRHCGDIFRERRNIVYFTCLYIRVRKTGVLDCEANVWASCPCRLWIYFYSKMKWMIMSLRAILLFFRQWYLVHASSAPVTQRSSLRPPVNYVATLSLRL